MNPGTETVSVGRSANCVTRTESDLSYFVVNFAISGSDRDLKKDYIPSRAKQTNER
jgi:hypothetical protein